MAKAHICIVHEQDDNVVKPRRGEGGGWVAVGKGAEIGYKYNNVNNKKSSGRPLSIPCVFTEKLCIVFTFNKNIIHDSK